MSMLTPPGMGGKYKITGDKYPRMRQRRRRGRLVAAVVASVAALAIIAWGTLQLIDVFTGGGKKASAAGTKADCGSGVSPSAGPSAGAKGAAAPKPGQITVNVYNATTRSGLAKSTADELKKRGFKIGKVGNAPAAYDKKIKGAGILLGPKAATDGPLKVLATQLAGAEQKTDDRKSTDLDLIIGDGFKTLATKPASDKALAALADPKPTPTSKKSC